jgi:hypothetical protein
MEHCELDFISIHHYGNTLKGKISNNERMDQTKFLFHDSFINLDRLIRKKAPNRHIRIVNSEYSSDYRSSFMSHLDEQYTAAWYASALIWQIRSGVVDLEMYYSGTSNRPDGGFGMWAKNRRGSYSKWPVFDMKK